MIHSFRINNLRVIPHIYGQSDKPVKATQSRTTIPILRINLRNKDMYPYKDKYRNAHSRLLIIPKAGDHTVHK